MRGIEHLRAAMTGGRGVVLWVSHFEFHSLLAKVALQRAGIALCHLSHPHHGFSGTRFGVHVLNRVRTFIEDRYLMERVLPLPVRLQGGAGKIGGAAHGGRSGVDRRQRHRAKTRHRRLSRRPAAAGDRRTGPGTHATGAALLPLHVLKADDGALAVVVEPAIAVDTKNSRWEAAEAAARQYAARLEAVVLAFPDQWQGWFYEPAGS